MLSVGSRGSDVTRLQQTLSALGFDPRGDDGVFGDRTRLAVEAYQRTKGLSVDGKVGSNTGFSLFKSRDAKFLDGRSDFQRPSGGRTGSLSVGSRGSDVTRLQQTLSALGYKPGVDDGVFGDRTRLAVEAFQRWAGLSVDGKVGPNTGAALFRSSDSKFWDGRIDFQAGRSGGSTRVRAGRGWGGSEGVVDRAKDIAAELGVPITSLKRDLRETRRVGSSTGSDHFTGNSNAYAADFGVGGPRGNDLLLGDELARRIADAYGIPRSIIGTNNSYIINVDGQRYRVQLLWRVKDHFDHVHIGVRRL